MAWAAGGQPNGVRERYEAHARLERIEGELRRVLASVSDCLWSGECAPDGPLVYRYVSPVVESLTGRPPSAFLGPSAAWEGIIHPEDRPALRRTLQEALRDGEGHNIVFRVRLENREGPPPEMKIDVVTAQIVPYGARP